MGTDAMIPEDQSVGQVEKVTEKQQKEEQGEEKDRRKSKRRNRRHKRNSLGWDDASEKECEENLK